MTSTLHAAGASRIRVLFGVVQRAQLIARAPRLRERIDQRLVLHRPTRYEYKYTTGGTMKARV